MYSTDPKLGNYTVAALKKKSNYSNSKSLILSQSIRIIQVNLWILNCKTSKMKLLCSPQTFFSATSAPCSEEKQWQQHLHRHLPGQQSDRWAGLHERGHPPARGDRQSSVGSPQHLFFAVFLCPLLSDCDHLEAFSQALSRVKQTVRPTAIQAIKAL